MNVMIQCGDHYENQRRILPLAVSLKNRGYEPYVLVYDQHEGNIFKRLNINVIFLDKRKIKKEVSVQESYKDLNVNNITDCDRQKQPWRFWPGRIKAYYSQLYLYVDAVLAVIEKVNPDFIFVWNGYTGFCANILREYCRKKSIKHAYLERGLLKDSVFVDVKGVNGFSSLSDLTFGYEQRLVESQKRASAKTIFMPLQVQSDTNILYHSPYIKSMRHFVLMVADECQKLGHRLIVRQHPEEIDENLNLPFMECIEYRNDGTIEEWVCKSDLTITINSTVGLEAIINEKPVVSFGKSIYSNKGLDINGTPKNLDKILRSERKVVIYPTNKIKLADFMTF